VKLFDPVCHEAIDPNDERRADQIDKPGGWRGDRPCSWGAS